MASSFAKECEGIIAEMVETSKALKKAEATHVQVETAHKESTAVMFGLVNKFDQLKTLLHETVEKQVSASK